MSIETPRLKLSDSLKLMFSKVDRYINNLSGHTLQKINFQKNEFEKEGKSPTEIRTLISTLKKELETNNNVKIDKIKTKLAQTLFIIKNNKVELEGYKPSKFNSIDEQNWFDKKLTEEEKNQDLMAKYKMYKVQEKSVNPSLEDKIMFNIGTNCREIIYGNIVDKKRGLFKEEMDYLQKQFEKSPYYKDWWENSDEPKKLGQKIGKSVSQINRDDLILTYTLPVVSSVIKKSLEEYSQVITKLYKNDEAKINEKVNSTSKIWKEVEVGLSKLLPNLITLNQKQTQLNRTTLNQTVSLNSDKLEKEISSLEFNINLITNTISSQALNKVKEIHKMVVRISEGQNNLLQKEPENYRNVSIEVKRQVGKNSTTKIIDPLASDKQKKRFGKEIKKIKGNEIER